jgi:hypothetical protein
MTKRLEFILAVIAALAAADNNGGASDGDGNL